MRAAKERFVVDKDGKKKEVIVPVARYNQLLEDLHDLAVVAERRREGPIGIEVMRRRLKDHGLI